MWRGRLLGKRLSGLIGLLGPRLGFRDRRLVDGWLRRWRQGPMFLRFEKPVEVREVIANDAVLARAQLDEGNTKVPQPPIAAQCVHAEPESARGNILVNRHRNGLGTRRNRRGTVGRCRHRSLSPRIVVGQDYSAIGKVNGMVRLDPARASRARARAYAGPVLDIPQAGVDRSELEWASPQKKRRRSPE